MLQRRLERFILLLACSAAAIFGYGLGIQKIPALLGSESVQKKDDLVRSNDKKILSQDKKNEEIMIPTEEVFDEQRWLPARRASQSFEKTNQTDILSSASPSKPKSAQPASSKSPLGAGMATRELIAGGQQAGAALDLVWEGNAQSQNQTRSAQPVSAPDWKIVGAVQRTGVSFLIVQFDGQSEPRLFKLGDRLPGGGIVSWVNQKTLGVSMGSGQSAELPILEEQQQSLANRRQAILAQQGPVKK